MKIWDRILTIIIVICVILIFVFGGFILYIYISNPLEYRKPNRYIELTYSRNWTNYTRQEVRSDLESLFNAKCYTYKEDNLSLKGVYGLTKPMLRTVTMDDDISIELYTFYLAHELVHLTHFTSSERYCNLIAFKTLYNTEKYRDIAICYAIQDRNGCITQDYSCWEYIFDYLMEGKIWQELRKCLESQWKN